MRKHALTLSAAALVLAGASAALADQHGAHHGSGKHGPDADGDGVVTQAEAAAMAERMWDRMDTNGDGAIDQTDRDALKAKWAEKRAERAPERFAAMDADGNGEVSLAEMQAHHAERMARRAERRGASTDAARPDRQERHARMFAKLDTDGSGGLSGEEMKAGHDMHKGRHGKRGGHAMHGGGMMASMADANDDGTITRAEFDAARASHFARVDTDGDGQISQAEHKAARAAMKAKWQERRAARQAD